MADILDAAGVKIGESRDNQDPDAPTRMHPVPVIDPATGEQKVWTIPVVDEEGNPVRDPKTGDLEVDRVVPVFDMVPLEYGRAQAQLEKEGLVHVGDGVLVDADTVDSTDA